MQDLFIEFLPPWVETGLQPAFYDRESGTVLQQTARMYAKVNELVKAVNGMDKVVKEYVDYIDNYFKNLDVQEEINNKLDDMAEGGELAEIIAQYANLPCIHAYATISDMASSENLEAGSFARAMSKTVAGTGDGFYYYIRIKTGADTPDGENLVAIGDTLVGVKIPDYALDNLANTVSDLSILKNRKFLFVGDSYGTGHNELQEQTTPWTVLVPQHLGLTVGTNCWSNSSDGSGFNNGYTFKAQLQDLATTVPDTDEITDIVIVGGYNDQSYTENVIDNKMSECFSYAKTTFPNAKIYLACVGWSRVYDPRHNISSNVLPAYQKCGKYGVKYLTNTEWILHDYSLFSNDNYHPNQNGQYELSAYLSTAILNGSCDVNRIKQGSNLVEKLEQDDVLNPDYVIEIQHNGTIDVALKLNNLVKNTPVNLGSGTIVGLCYLSTNGLVMGSGIDCFTESTTMWVGTSTSGDQAQVAGKVDIKYNLSNAKPIFNFITDKRPETETNPNMAIFGTNDMHFTLPAGYC